MIADADLMGREFHGEGTINFCASILVKATVVRFCPFKADDALIAIVKIIILQRN